MADFSDPRLSFINTAAKALGVDAGIIGAHVQLEVGSNSKTVGQFNFGNIKAGKGWAGKVANVAALEYDAGGNAVKEPSAFRSYTSPEEAGQDYAALLMRRYPGAAGAKSSADFATALKAGGYATDPSYVQKFVSVAGGSLPAAPKEPRSELMPAQSYQRLADPLQEVMPTRMRLPGAGGKGLPDLTVPANPPVLPVDRVAETQAGALESQRKTEAESISFLEQSQRAFLGTLSGAALRAKVARDILGDNLPDPAYKLDPKLLRGLTTSEQDYMLGAQNPRDEEHRKFSILDERESREKVFIKGTGWGLLAGAVAGLPEGAVGGMAVYRMMSLLGAGSAALMAQGRTGAAIASSVGENVLLDTALAGIQAKIDPFFTASDAVVQVGLGTLLSSAVSVPLLLREGSANARLQGLVDAQSAQRVADTEAAEARLGPDATPAALGQQVQRMEVERAEAEIDAVRRVPPEGLLPETARWDSADGELGTPNPAPTGGNPTPTGGNLSINADPSRGRTVLPKSESAPMRTWEQLATAQAGPESVLAAAPWAQAAIASGDIHVLPKGTVLPDYPNAVAAYSSKLRKTFVVDGARPEDVRAALLGSYGAQQGLAQAVGDSTYNAAIAAVGRLASAGNKVAADIVRRVPGNSVEALELRLGLFVEEYPKASLVTRLLDSLSGWWGKLTGKLDMSASDLLKVIEGSVKSRRGDVVAFSGGPRNFDEFSTEYVGTGEGNISQGWGLYFSESSGVADWYRKKEALSRGGREDSGVLYKVTIARKADEFLDWSGNSPPGVKQALQQLGLRGDGELAYRSLMARYEGTNGERAKQASIALSAAGVAGTRYKAGGGRVNAWNYVAYSDRDVNITKKFMSEDVDAQSMSKDASVFSRDTQELSKDTVLPNGYVVKEPGTTGGFDEWALPGNWGTRRELFSPGGAFEDKINQRTKGLVKSLAELEALKPGVHATADTPPHFLQPMRAARQLATKFLGEDFRIVLSTIDTPGVRGAVLHPTPNSAVIMIDPKLGEVQAVRTMIHEVGHMIWHKHLEKMPDSTKQAVDMAYQRFMRAWSSQLGGGAVAVDRRFSLLSPERETTRLPASGYVFSRDEHAAEQFVKYIEDDLRAQGVILDRSLSETLKGALARAIEFITKAGRRLIGVEDEFKAFFDEVKANVAAAKPAPVREAGPTKKLTLRRSEQQDAQQDVLDSKEALATDPDVQRLGLGIAPMETPQQRAEILLIKDLHEKAKSPAYAVDEVRLSKLLNTAMFQGGQSIANTMLRSKNAVMRMAAAMLAESPSGAAGRRGTAAIAKHLHEQAFLGNTINEVQAAYNVYRREAGGTLVGDVFGGKVWKEFNKKIARELEARGRGARVTSNPEVVKAADRLEEAYERMRTTQVNTKTVGWANLPSSSKGYMPHRLSGERIRNATNAELATLHSALTDQFIRDLGFDPTFSDMLAAKYIDRVKHRALGGADAPVGAQHIGSSELVEEALQATGMGADEIRAVMKKLMTAGPGHTKKRLQLDLNAEHTLADGSTFRLGDLFEDDQFTLLRSQATRVSGEVALTEYGVFGKAGLDVLRRAATFGPEGAASKAEFDAFDQMAAEFLGAPYGTQSKLVDRVLQANAVARLGGIGFNQAGEYINGIWHVGAGRTMQAIADIPRLLGEVRALARGEAVDNGILEGLEKVYGGAEFGTQSYKTVFPFDNKGLDPHSYGEETVTLMDRLLRGASHMQAKLSFWRAIHSVQQRGMAEQIVRKAVVFMKEGKSGDAALKSMRLSDDLIAKMQAELPRIATWDANGRLMELDVTKAQDLDAAREFAQVVHRGVSQIIQGTFIGERSKWATDANMRLLTQFRTFGLTAIEKQYGRQVGNVGEVKALGILLGSMCMVLPIYAARMQVQAVGREDQEEFLERAFQPERMARQTLNYVAGSGLSGDFLDALGALSGVDLGGGRTGKEQDFVGNMVMPAAGLFNDTYKALQNTEEGTDPEKFLKALPFANLPHLGVLVRSLGED